MEADEGFDCPELLPPHNPDNTIPSNILRYIGLWALSTRQRLLRIVGMCCSATSSPSEPYAFGEIDPQASGNSVFTGVAAFAAPNLNLTNDDTSNGSLTGGVIQN